MSKRILIVNDILQGGGVEKLMHDLVLYFHKKYEITILTDVRDREFDKLYPADVGYLYQMEEPYPETNSKIGHFRERGQRRFREGRLKQTILERKFDVMLCLKESWIMLMALTYGAEIPCKLAWVHTDYTKSYYTKMWYGSEEKERLTFQSFDHVICVSKVILDGIKEVIGDPGNLLLAYNPLDRDLIRIRSLEPVEDIQKSERLLFVTVGRLNYQKGYDILLEVCNLLNQEGYEYDVWIVGGGEKADNYQVQRDLEHLRYTYHLENVYFLGNQANPYNYMAQADWFLSTSRYEGYSYVSQEAAILERPLILTACSGVMELLENEENGIVMENSYARIYLGMRKAIEQRTLHQQYQGRVKVQSQEYYWDRRFEAIEQLFVKDSKEYEAKK